MIRFILLLATIGLASGNDSLRIVQLEGQLQAIEREKAIEQRNQDLARIATMEADIRQMASAQSALDNKSIWAAGDKIESSIILSLAGSACILMAQVGASNDNPGLAFIGLIGGLAFEVGGLMKLYGAGEDLKKASNKPVVTLAPSPQAKPLMRSGNNPNAW